MALFRACRLAIFFFLSHLVVCITACEVRARRVLLRMQSFLKARLPGLVRFQQIRRRVRKSRQRFMSVMSLLTSVAFVFLSSCTWQPYHVIQVHLEEGAA